MKKLKSVMLAGTGSDVGKSVLTAGLCRIFLQDGFRPAPFKGQNMSLNSFPTPDGFEIGRAQAVQAEACSVPPLVQMNPVLLKPSGNKVSQVILNGKPAGNESAKQYFNARDRNELFTEVCNAYDFLNARYNPVVMEGAGSISELNLKDRDITNLRIALYADAAVYLVGDIDRGGIFGSLYGTVKLLEPEERKLIKGIIVNKFRGDIDLFSDGKKILEDICEVPVVGIVPYYRDIVIEDEDSVALHRRYVKAGKNRINCCVILLEHMSNFTDFNALEHDERFHLFYSRDPEEILKSDIVIIPGSKNTINDLQSLKSDNTAEIIKSFAQRGGSVIGICGGYQMMGRVISDKYGVEGEKRDEAGLSLLDVSTVLERSKTTVQKNFIWQKSELKGSGYEIHMGSSEIISDSCSYLTRDTKTMTEEGCMKSDKVWGTYIHGIFDNNFVRNELAETAGFKGTLSKDQDYSSFKEENYNKLAQLLRESLDMERIYADLRTEE